SMGKADGEALETGDCLHERHVPRAVGSLEVVAVGGVEVLDGDLVHGSSISSLDWHPYPRHSRELMWFRAGRPQGRGTTGPAPRKEQTGGFCPGFLKSRRLGSTRRPQQPSPASRAALEFLPPVMPRICKQGISTT